MLIVPGWSFWQVFSKQKAFGATSAPVLMCHAHKIPWLHTCLIFKSIFFRSKSLFISLAFYVENQYFQAGQENKFGVITASDGNYSSQTAP